MVLFVANQLDAMVLARYSALSVPRRSFKTLLVDGPSIDGNSAIPHQCFSLAAMIRRGYRPLGEKLVPGNNHFPVIEQAATGPADFTWCVEYDVAFNGNWQRFFIEHENSDADLLTAFVATKADDPWWFWWDSLTGPDGIPLRLSNEQLIKSFNPVYRISKRAARFLRNLYRSGWRGHHEVSMPTLLMLGGYRVEDFGGTGRFVMPQNWGKWYYAESYSHSNSISIEFDQTTRNRLFHPVKLILPAEQLL
jgi:hypothetical protein